MTDLNGEGRTVARIWDPFLTPRDRDLADRQPVMIRGASDRPALLLVDLYRAAFGVRRMSLLDSIMAWPSSCGEAAWDAIPAIQAILQAARTAHIPVIHLTAGPRSGAWRPPRATTSSAAQPTSPASGNLDEFAIIDELAPTDDEVVIVKTGPSGFAGTDLLPQLISLGVDSVIVCGETTSGCVRATVVDACTLRFRVTVAEDGCFDRGEASHAINLFDMSQKYAEVVAHDVIVRRLSGA